MHIYKKTNNQSQSNEIDSCIEKLQEENAQLKFAYSLAEAHIERLSLKIQRLLQQYKEEK